MKRVVFLAGVALMTSVAWGATPPACPLLSSSEVQALTGPFISAPETQPQSEMDEALIKAGTQGCEAVGKTALVVWQITPATTFPHGFKAFADAIREQSTHAETLSIAGSEAYLFTDDKGHDDSQPGSLILDQTGTWVVNLVTVPTLITTDAAQKTLESIVGKLP